MSLVKLATENDPIKKQHNLTKNIATTYGGILGGLYGGAIVNGKSKNLRTAERALDTAKKGHTKIENPSFLKRLFGAKPKSSQIIDNQRVNKLSKIVTKLKRIRGVKTGLGAVVGATVLGAGMRKIQDVNNHYEVALMKNRK